MQSTLKYVNEFDSFSTPDILYARYVQFIQAGPDAYIPRKMRLARKEYLKAASRHVGSLRLIRTEPNEFLDVCARTSNDHLTILFLTSPDSLKDRTLSTRSIAEPCLSDNFANGQGSKLTVALKHIYRPHKALAARVKLTTGFRSRLKVVSFLYLGDYFSSNTSLTLDVVLENPQIDWVWPRLAKNPGIDPLELIINCRNNRWSFSDLSRNPRVTEDLVRMFPDEKWNFEYLNAALNPTRVPEFTFADMDKTRGRRAPPVKIGGLNLETQNRLNYSAFLVDQGFHPDLVNCICKFLW